MDEAVFTSNQVRATAWSLPGVNNSTIPKAKLSFKAVAVVAAVDTNGEVIGVTLNPKSIRAESFREFLDKCAQHVKKRKTYMFLDNLHLHHNKEIIAYAKQRKLHFLWNAPYSPVYNGGVEGLWAYAKR